MKKGVLILIVIVIACTVIAVSIAALFMARETPEVPAGSIEDLPLEIQLYEGQAMPIRGGAILVFKETGAEGSYRWPFEFAVYQLTGAHKSTWTSSNGTQREVVSADVETVWEGNFSDRETICFSNAEISDPMIAWLPEGPRGVVTVKLEIVSYG